MNIREKLIFRTNRRELAFGARTLVMGILNVTPDSFSDGGRFASHEAAVEEGLRMESEGADMLDVGGESSRPGSEAIPLEEELRRVIPVIRELGKKVNIPISVDTTKAAVAREAIDCGAEIINDISAMRFDDGMCGLAAATGAGVILMHMRGMPKTMQTGPLVYRSLISDISKFLRERLDAASACGVQQERTMIDPGIGFGKTAEDNMRLLKHLARFKKLGRPILTGVSRKSFIGKVLAGEPSERLEGTAAAVAVAVLNGSSVVRVHDVKVMKKIVDMTDAIGGV